MRITEELRTFAYEWGGILGHDDGKKELLAIADRIDAEHVRQQEDFIDETLGGLIKMTDEKMAENGWVRLPKDADGEYIHIGDVMEGYGKTIEVVELRYGRSGWVLISRDGNGYADTFAFAHHHKPTVEDVLREMMRDAACQFHDDGTCEMGLTYEQFDKYAQRLQLRETVS